MISFSIVGPGRVGGALALSLPAEKYSLAEVVRRNSSSLDDSRLPSGVRSTTLDEIDTLAADVVFITTQDPEVESTATALSGKLKSGSVVFHTSGSQPSSILGALKDSGSKIGSIHPLVSVSSAELGPERFRGAYFCVEGDTEAVALGQQIARDLGGRPFSIDTKFKILYHAAAVTACGHLVALFDTAVEMMSKAGLSTDDAKQILLPLVTSTVLNLGEQTTAAALTGTFARADSDTFTKHLTALNQYGTDEMLEIYLLLGERSLELATAQGVNAERIETLRTKVAIAKSKLKW